jgi:hypothetical protein
MRALQIKWHCDTNNNTLCAEATMKGGTCEIRVVVENIQREIARVSSYIQELANVGVSDVEPRNKQAAVSIVS